MMAIIGFLLILVLSLCMAASGISLMYAGIAYGDTPAKIAATIFTLIGAGLMWLAVTHSPFAVSMVSP